MVSNISPASEKKYLTFLIDYVVNTSPDKLQCNLQHLSTHMLDNMDALDSLNLHRKQYGNLKDSVLKSNIVMSVFKLDGTCFKFRKWNEVVAANNAGNMEEAAWERAQEGYKSFMTAQLTLCKNNNMNICKTCDMRYYVAAQHTGCGKNNGGAHNPGWDFTVDPDNVLNCGI